VRRDAGAALGVADDGPPLVAHLEVARDAGLADVGVADGDERLLCDRFAVGRVRQVVGVTVSACECVSVATGITTSSWAPAARKVEVPIAVPAASATASVPPSERNTESTTTDPPSVVWSSKRRFSTCAGSSASPVP
jgi:hypothetical protein